MADYVVPHATKGSVKTSVKGSVKGSVKSEHVRVIQGTNAVAEQKQAAIARRNVESQWSLV